MRDESVTGSNPCAIIHERQSLQLCGVQTVNNLLQLSADLGNDSSAVFCCGSTIIQRKGIEGTRATKQEFDRIADEMTVRENDLIKCGGTSTAISEGRMPSLLERFKSNHRTLILGNYSYEVLEIALKKRNIHLTRCQVPGENTSPCYTKTPSDDKTLVGFIVNIHCDSSSSLVNYARRWIPGFNSLFFSGNHWYAITRLRSIEDTETETCGALGKIPWTIIDGLHHQTVEFAHDKDLETYLNENVSRGGSIFQASIQNNE